MLLLDNLQHPCSWDNQFQLGLICCAKKWARRCEELKLARSIIMMLMLAIVRDGRDKSHWLSGTVVEQRGPVSYMVQLESGMIHRNT